jgi:hypothetical protein
VLVLILQISNLESAVELLQELVKNELCVDFLLDIMRQLMKNAKVFRISKCSIEIVGPPVVKVLLHSFKITKS